MVCYGGRDGFELLPKPSHEEPRKKSGQKKRGGAEKHVGSCENPGAQKYPGKRRQPAPEKGLEKAAEKNLFHHRCGKSCGGKGKQLSHLHATRKTFSGPVHGYYRKRNQGDEAVEQKLESHFPVPAKDESIGFVGFFAEVAPGEGAVEHNDGRERLCHESSKPLFVRNVLGRILFFRSFPQGEIHYTTEKPRRKEKSPSHPPGSQNCKEERGHKHKNTPAYPKRTGAFFIVQKVGCRKKKKEKKEGSPLPGRDDYRKISHA